MNELGLPRDAVPFGFIQLIGRLEEGDATRDEALAEAEQSVEEAYGIAARKLFNIDVDELQELRDRVFGPLEVGSPRSESRFPMVGSPRRIWPEGLRNRPELRRIAYLARKSA